MMFAIIGLLACSSSKKDTAENGEALVYHKDGYNFRSAESCRPCHDSIVDEWSYTSHATTARNPIYTRMAEKFLRDRGTTFASTTCTGCHLPGGPMIGQPPALPYEQHNPIAQEGVTCEACHSANQKTEDVVGEFEAIRLRFEKDGTVFGAEDLGQVGEHRVAKNDLISSPDLCLGCHDPHISYFGSLAESEGFTCMDCHMTTTPGNPYDGEFTHQIVGLGYAYRDAVQSAPNRAELLSKQQRMVEEALEIVDVQRVQRNGEDVLTVSVANTANSHWLPSVGGVNNLRQVWLSVEVRDSTGQVIFESGKLDSKGDLLNAYSEDVQRGQREEDTQLQNFQTTDQTLVQTDLVPVILSIDSSGTHVENSFHSEELKNMEYRLGMRWNEPLHVQVALKQRHYTPYMLREIDLDELAAEIPIFTIDTWEGEQ